MRSCIIVGATGLIGTQLLQLLVDSIFYNRIIVTSRSAIKHNSEKVEILVVDFNNLHEYAEKLVADDIYCCLGTTIKKARTTTAFRTVDYDYPLSLATITRSSGATRFLLVSALGANKNDAIFYNKVKGEVEETIGKVGFPTYHIFRPSLLLGPRQEQRSGEEAAKVFYKFFDFLIPKKYKAIDSAKVGKAMLHFALQEQPGVFIHESEALQKF